MIDTNKIASAAMQELVDYAQKNRGAVKELTETLTTMLGRKVHRQIVEAYLHPEPAKRMKPTLGMGLVIIDEGKKMMAKPRKIDLPRLIAKGKV